MATQEEKETLLARIKHLVDQFEALERAKDSIPPDNRNNSAFLRAFEAQENRLLDLVIASRNKAADKRPLLLPTEEIFVPWDFDACLDEMPDMAEKDLGGLMDFVFALPTEDDKTDVRVKRELVLAIYDQPKILVLLAFLRPHGDQDSQGRLCDDFVSSRYCLRAIAAAENFSAQNPLDGAWDWMFNRHIQLAIAKRSNLRGTKILSFRNAYFTLELNR